MKLKPNIQLFADGVTTAATAAATVEPDGTASLAPTNTPESATVVEAAVEGLVGNENVNLQQEVDALRSKLAIYQNRMKAERLFASSGIAQTDIETILDAVIAEDEETSIGRTQTVLDAINRSAAVLAKGEIQSTMAAVRAPVDNPGTENVSQSDSYAAALGRKKAQERTAAQDVLKHYTGGNR